MIKSLQTKCVRRDRQVQIYHAEGAHIHLNRSLGIMGTRSAQIGELCPKVDIMRAIVSSRRKAQQLSKCSHTRPNSESQSWKSNSRRQFSAITYKSVNIQQPNDHRTASAPLYSPPPSQLTSAEPRTRSGKTVRQPPRVTGLSQSEGTNTPVLHRTYTARRRRP